MTFFSCCRSLILLTAEEGERSGDGYIYAFLLLVLTVIKSIVVRHHIHQTQIAGQNNWTAMTTTIYKKVNQITNSVNHVNRSTKTFKFVMNIKQSDYIH